LWQVDELNDVPADEIVFLGAPDRPGERALDLQERGFAKRLGGVPKEAIGVGGLEVLQLCESSEVNWVKRDRLKNLKMDRSMSLRIDDFLRFNGTPYLG
jgi:hypothetical protein